MNEGGRGLVDLGDLITEKLTEQLLTGNPVEFPDVDNSLVMCVFGTYRDDDFLTMDATVRRSGFIVLGPYGTRKCGSKDDLTHLMQAHRWVLNPVHLGGENTGRPAHCIIGNPNICLIHRVATTCPACGFTGYEWKDQLITRNRHLNQATGDGPAPRWSENMVARCTSCNKGRLTLRRLYSTAIRHNTDSDDPVLENPAMVEKVTARMMQWWEEGPPADGQPTLYLPRVWGVYSKDRVPDPTWQPQDRAAQRLCDALAVMKMGVPPTVTPHTALPYVVARPYHQAPNPISTALRGFKIDSPALISGWIRIRDLYPDPVLGFKRRFWHDQKIHGRREDLPDVEYLDDVQA